jgi:hypothetical protein
VRGETTVSASMAARRFHFEGVEQDSTTYATPRLPPVEAARRSTSRRPASWPRPLGRRIGEDHDIARAMSRKPLASSRARIDRPSFAARPDVRLPPERGEEDEGLGQTAIEGTRVGRPADPFEPVPERLTVVRVVEQDGVAKVAQLPPGDGVDAGLVEEESSHRARVDRWVGPGGARVVIANIPAGA